MIIEVFSTACWDRGVEKFRQTVQMGEDRDSVENEVVNLYPDVSYDTFEGFGGAVTEAAGYVYSRMDEQQKREVVETYFTENAMNYRHVRVHIDSCDFCLGQYEALSDPAFMKTNGKRDGGGKLRKEYQDMWAEYICRYIHEFQKRGFPVERISLQNEPNAVQNWDSCIWTGEEEKEFLKNHMHPALERNGLGRIGIYIWDHNKERVYERALDILDEETRDLVEGIAFHWYSGDHRGSESGEGKQACEFPDGGKSGNGHGAAGVDYDMSVILNKAGKTVYFSVARCRDQGV